MLYAIFKINNKKVRVISLILFAMSIYSLLPLLVVYPIGARCLFHAYIAMEMFATINYASIVNQDRSVKKIISEIAVYSMVVLLLGISFRINRIDEMKNSYIKECMRKGKTEIKIFKINSD